MKEAIILAGGRGTRLSEVVSDLPKPMAPICGRPFLSYLLSLLDQQKFEHVVLSVGYKAEAIENEFGESFRGLALSYALEENPLGTGGAIRAALEHTGEQSVFVFNGDTMAIIDTDELLAAHEARNDAITLALMRVENVARYGAVLDDHGDLQSFTEKGKDGPGNINAGIYVLSRNLFAGTELPEKFSFEQEVLMRAADFGRAGVVPFAGYFIDIGVPEDYYRAQIEFPPLAL